MTLRSREGYEIVSSLDNRSYVSAKAYRLPVLMALLFCSFTIPLSVKWYQGRYTQILDSQSGSPYQPIAKPDKSLKGPYRSISGWHELDNGRPLPIGATFEERIHSWENAPTDCRFDFMMLNLRHCPASKARGGFPYWFFGGQWKDTISQPDFIQETRSQAIQYLKKQQKQGRFASKRAGAGKGVLIVAGNGNTFAIAQNTIRLLRDRYKSDVPVEIWSYPSETPPKDLLEWCSSRNVVFKQVKEEYNPEGHGSNWNYRIKTLALIESDFQEILMLDSDAFPLLDPIGNEGIFDAPAYKKHGFMLWSNIWDLWAEMPLWQMIGVPCRSELMVDSGVLLVDKAKHLDTLYLSLYIQSQPAGNIWGTLTFGDCDSFRFALLALRKRWAIPGRQPGLTSWSNIPEFCGHTLLHFDHMGKPAFLHALSVKHLKAAGVHPFTPGPAGEIWGISRTGPLGTANGSAEADHLVNVDVFGNAELPDESMKRRAALERGSTYHYSAGLKPPHENYPNCLQQEFRDLRSQEEKEVSEWVSIYEKATSVNQHEVFTGRKEDWAYQGDVIMWKDDDRLRDFEEAFWAVGGVF